MTLFHVHMFYIKKDCSEFDFLFKCHICSNSKQTFSENLWNVIIVYIANTSCSLTDCPITSGSVYSLESNVAHSMHLSTSQPFREDYCCHNSIQQWVQSMKKAEHSAYTTYTIQYTLTDWHMTYFNIK